MNTNLAYVETMDSVKESVVEMAEVIKEHEDGKIAKFVKRSIDIIISLIGIICLIPLTILVVTVNFFSREKGPIFFVQKRIGKDGKLFRMYKYRTMVQNADRVLREYIEQDEEFKREYQLYKKVKHDPRITKAGKFLRKTSLDEFPQFINILKGDMSLVGPRPYLPREKTDMKDYYYYIITMKPGLTGPWQTSGRSEVTFDDRLKMDLEYYKKSSLKNDARYFFKTFAKILKKEGAI